jgi:hypothetical protein
VGYLWFFRRVFLIGFWVSGGFEPAAYHGVSSSLDSDLTNLANPEDFGAVPAYRLAQGARLCGNMAGVPPIWSKNAA